MKESTRNILRDACKSAHTSSLKRELHSAVSTKASRKMAYAELLRRRHKRVK